MLELKLTRVSKKVPWYPCTWCLITSGLGSTLSVHTVYPFPANISHQIKRFLYQGGLSIIQLVVASLLYWSSFGILPFEHQGLGMGGCLKSQSWLATVVIIGLIITGLVSWYRDIMAVMDFSILDEMHHNYYKEYCSFALIVLYCNKPSIAVINQLLQIIIRFIKKFDDTYLLPVEQAFKNSTICTWWSCCARSRVTSPPIFLLVSDMWWKICLFFSLPSSL